MVGDRLAAVADHGVISLHDRRKPGSRANIDHIAVAPKGIYVIDAKNHTGRVERRDVGGWLRSDVRLYVNGRDRTEMADKIRSQAEAVRTTLDGQFDRVPIRAVLCFVGGDFPLLAKPFEVRGVTITWPRALQKQLRAPGPVARPEVEAIAELLNARLRPA